MSANVKLGFVAALEREVHGLASGWKVTDAPIAGVPHSPNRMYRHENAAVVCAGTGVARAYAAAKVLIEKYSPEVIVSIGFAGSCMPSLRAGSVVVPATVLEAETGNVFCCAAGRGQLVTLDRVAGKAIKHDAATRFGAVAVDMEAAGVAAAAAEYGRQFVAIKAISDGADEDLGFLSDFVRPEGFATGRFLAHIALRPGLWPKVAMLQRNSKAASAALETAVRECMSDWQGFSAKYSSAAAQVSEKRVVKEWQ
jgi:nucleoside phosphorylase